MSTETVSESIRRVQSVLTGHGHPFEPVTFGRATRTAEEAAAALGCALAQIVKSLVFRGAESDRPVLVLASGINRVDEARLGRLLGEPATRADAGFVRRHSGFAIGGVAPVGHLTAMVTYMDRDLMQFERVWAAAGTPHTVFSVAPPVLLRMTAGELVIVN